MVTPSSAQPAAPALSLPGLELYEKLGQGGMGVVYRARDVRLDRPRAVKVIRRSPFGGDEARERFSREAKAVARLDHAGVVRIYALGEHEDTLYICMELLEGGSLQGRLSRGPLEVRAAADLVRQLALAVQHAHENRVLHRDLKPGNVLLTADGTPKVSDFGLAKLLDADDGLTQTGAVLGTPSYMAPEQAEGRQSEVSERTDVWALGAILYECLTGRPPFRGETRSRTLRQVTWAEPVPPRQLRAEVPADLEAVCLKCLEKRPERRYVTAAELAADLQDWLDGKPTRARPPRGPRRLLRALRRRPRAALLVGLVLLAAVGAMFAYLGHPDRPLWQMRAQLARGEPVELIGATGKPRWSRFRMGEKDARAIVEKDGTFVVHGVPLTLLELLPDTGGLGHYRIRAEACHLKSGLQGFIGLYFAGTSHGEVPVPVFSFLQVTFNDVQDEADIVYNVLPPNLRPGVRRPQGNRVRLASWYYATDADKPVPGLRTGFYEPELFKPAGLARSERPGDWRALRVEVSPELIQVFWNDKSVGQLRPDQAESSDRASLEQHRQNNPDNPAWDGLVPRLDLHGEIGLLLYESSASFRNVRVEPLDGADAPN
jgi:serine/threonine-protein kinase